MATVDANQRPHGKTEATIRIQAQGHMPAGIQFTGELQAGAQRRQRTMRHDDATQTAARRNAKVQIGGRVQSAGHNSRQFTFRIVINVKDAGPAFRINGGGRFAGLEQFDDRLNGQNDTALADIDDHPDGGQRCDEILRMRWPYGDWHRTQIQAAVKSANQIEARRKDQRNMIAGLNFAALLQQSGDLLGAFVQIGARERFGNGACCFLAGQRTGGWDESLWLLL